MVGKTSWEGSHIWEVIAHISVHLRRDMLNNENHHRRISLLLYFEINYRLYVLLVANMCATLVQKK